MVTTRGLIEAEKAIGSLQNPVPGAFERWLRLYREYLASKVVA